MEENDIEVAVKKLQNLFETDKGKYDLVMKNIMDSIELQVYKNTISNISQAIKQYQDESEVK